MSGDEMQRARKQNAALLGLLRRVQRALRLDGDRIDDAMRALADWCRAREEEVRNAD